MPNNKPIKARIVMDAQEFSLLGARVDRQFSADDEREVTFLKTFKFLSRHGVEVLIPESATLRGAYRTCQDVAGTMQFVDDLLPIRKAEADRIRYLHRRLDELNPYGNIHVYAADRPDRNAIQDRMPPESAKAAEEARVHIAEWNSQLQGMMNELNRIRGRHDPESLDAMLELREHAYRLTHHFKEYGESSALEVVLDCQRNDPDTPTFLMTDSHDTMRRVDELNKKAGSPIINKLNAEGVLAAIATHHIGEHAGLKIGGEPDVEPLFRGLKRQITNKPDFKVVFIDTDQPYAPGNSARAPRHPFRDIVGNIVKELGSPPQTMTLDSKTAPNGATPLKVVEPT